MLYEFALDPEVISDWKSFRYFVDSFGVSEGRLISQFPKHWKRMVYEAVRKNHPTEIERAKIEERLRRIDDRLLRQSRTYDGEKLWIENAIEKQHTEPFHAIITNQKQYNIEKVLDADEIDKDDKLWNVPTQKSVPRVAKHMAQAISSLLKIAQEVIFIDPYFDPNKRRFCRPLEHFLEEAFHQNPDIKRIEYHTKLKGDFKDETERLNFEYNFNDECQNNLASLIPNEIPITLIRWKEREGGKRFHARYILTDRGGVLIENGLDDDDDDGGQATPFILLNGNLFEEIWNDFQKMEDLAQCTYEYDNEIIVLGTKN